MYSRAILFLFLVLVFVSLLSPLHSSDVRSKRQLGLSIQLGNVLGTPTSSTQNTINRSPQTSHTALPDLNNAAGGKLDLLSISTDSRPNRRPSQTQPSNQASKDNRLPAGEFDRLTDYDRPKGPPSNTGAYGGSGPPGLNGELPPGLAKDKPNRPGGNRPGNEEVDQGTRCKGNQFHCGSGECLPKHMRCDSRFDCRDSSDEENCSGNSAQSPTEKPSNNKGSGRCTLPEQPVGGNYELGGCDRPCNKQPGDKVPGNSILTYSCRDGYSLSGNTISVCVNDSWYMPPSCQKTCPPLNSTSVDIKCMYKGEIVSCNEKIRPGTRAKLSCKDSYKLSLTNDPGYRDVTCLEEGLWDRTVFRCLPECGTAVAHGNTLVVHGFDAKVGVFPWHVGIYEKQSGTPNKEPEQICAGTLISGNLVVSAAHCFYDEANGRVRSPTNFAVAAGKHYRSWNAKENYVQKSDVEEIELTDRYIGARGNFAQDIALIKLNKSFELTALVRPVCLDWENAHEREQLQVGKLGKAVGWGKTIQGVPSENLQEVNLPFVPYDQCLSSVPEDFRGYITADKFCAGHMNGSSLCEGDSGGGLCFEMNKIWYLRGVVSVSPVRDGSCDYNSYVGFTYVSYFRDWIRATYIRT